MNFNEYKPTKVTKKELELQTVNRFIAILTFFIALFFAMKIACWMDFCVQAGI